jgi:hypothetical protein
MNEIAHRIWSLWRFGATFGAGLLALAFLSHVARRTKKFYIWVFAKFDIAR